MSRIGLLPVGAAALALGACGGGGSASKEISAAYCPAPFTVQDAQSLTRFKPGQGRDPRDVMYEASLTAAGTACAAGRGRMEVELKMRIAVNAGPAVGAGVSSVPYFVRVLDGNGAVREGQNFNADFKLSSGSPRGASLEELTLTLYYGRPTDLGGYRIAVGLKPTTEELEYNRRAAARQ